MRFGKWRFRLKRFKTGNTAFAVEILRSDRCAHHRTRAPRVDRYVLAAHQIAHHARIPAGQVQRDIAGHRRDGAHIEIRAGQRHHQHDGIIHARITINYKRNTRHLAPGDQAIE